MKLNLNFINYLTYAIIGIATFFIVILLGKAFDGVFLEGYEIALKLILFIPGITFGTLIYFKLRNIVKTKTLYLLFIVVSISVLENYCSFWYAIRYVIGTLLADDNFLKNILHFALSGFFGSVLISTIPHILSDNKINFKVTFITILAGTLIGVIVNLIEIINNDIALPITFALWYSAIGILTIKNTILLSKTQHS